MTIIFVQLGEWKLSANARPARICRKLAVDFGQAPATGLLEPTVVMMAKMRGGATERNPPEKILSEGEDVKALLISANTERINLVPLPLGLGCVAAATQSAGHDVRGLDLMREGDPE